VTGDGVVVEHVWRTRRGHTRQLAPRVRAALEDAGLAPDELAGVAVALGPGSYTGLRVGLSLAKGLAMAASLPLVGVPSLDAVAAALSAPTVDRAVPLWAVLQAGRGRVVAAEYPPDGDWPPAARTPVPLQVVLDAASAGDWIGGELDAGQRAAAAAAGLRVVPAVAALRRPSWIAQLGRLRRASAARSLEELSRIEPLYPISAAVADNPGGENPGGATSGGEAPSGGPSAQA
jgi:tRNA threonylcarbamoyladenosine biosynthesis protein TsaB